MREPAEADFAIKIDFDRDSPDPARVFKTAEELIHAFEAIDKDLVSVIDPKIQTIMVLEDIEAGSVKIWLRNILESTDDQALKELDWRPQVGKYLVKSKYVIMDLLDGKTTITDVLPFREMARRIGNLAKETDVKYLPDYKEPSVKALVDHTASLTRAKSALSDNDVVSFETQDGEKSFALTVDFSPETFDDFIIKETVHWPAAEMILMVKRPDYLGQAKWELRHGKSPVVAKIMDQEWLQKFQSRDPDANVRPGDALRCKVSREIAYGYDGEVVRDTYEVEQVVEVIEAWPDQAPLIGGPDA